MIDQWLRRPDFDILRLTASELADVASCHQGRFAHPWSEDEIHALMRQDTVFGFIARQTNPLLGRAALGGFVLARVAGGEGEILTIAVDSRFARLGLGWRLMLAALSEAKRRGAESMFLEVDETNHPAVGLYRRLNFQTVATRKAYYKGADGTRTGALVMRLDF
ncbi:ribosomal-protein-alanine acetyltransferase [Xaviernesmea oryzae]|uniref:Ribosomal-protein-alanine acetyltransferase n=1 Tax=Xaviernesmea oryzae TaxID=464029 RepID=A0A1Q9AV51_9HYPH|nr:ribosomal-protein-alanine acetyltransferase [Xaviernesmea oryzae]